MPYWIAIIDEQDHIVSNDILPDDLPLENHELPAGRTAVRSDFPAPNPFEHVIDRSTGAPRVVERVPPLEEIREEGQYKVDRMAGGARSRIITTVPGQAETYLAKEREARDWLAAEAAGDQPVLADYPMLQAETAVTGQSATEAAQAIVARADQWRVLGARIERVRRQGKLDIEAAPDAAGVEAVIERVQAELQTIITGG